MAAAGSKFTSTLGPAACEHDAKKLQLIEEVTRNCDREQEAVLQRILSQNASTEYLRRYGLNGATDRESFKAKIPVVTYEDLLPDIRRIADGDRSPILSSRPISEFLTSSGTSAGERKLIPRIAEDHDRWMLVQSLIMPIMKLHVPGLDKGKGLYFLFVKASTRTSGGLLARPALTSVLAKENFRHDADNVYTSPTAAILCVDAFQSMYVQMLCGLCQREEVLRVGAVFASSLLRAITFLTHHWEELAHDIATGTLSPCITDESVRASVSGVLRRDPALAEFITRECSGSEWGSIIRRIWPNTKYLDVIVTGAMAQYIPTLEYYGGGLPLVSTVYGSSECYFGINLGPMCRPSDVSYTIMPFMGYFEFLPLESSGITAADLPPRLVDLADVEVGREYELVITTYGGLNRCRVGDVLRVTGFHNTAPQFRFVRRQNVLLSIESDKTDEVDLQRAVESAAEVLRMEHGASVAEYTSHASTKKIPGHYVIYWELRAAAGAAPPDAAVMGRCCLAMEEALNSVYRQGRVADGSIGALEIRVVRPGTFEELMDLAIARGASINQYKAPRCVQEGPYLALLDSRVVSTHCSPRPPKWVPQAGSYAHAK